MAEETPSPPARLAPVPAQAISTFEGLVAPLEANLKNLKLIVLTVFVCFLLFEAVLYKYFITPRWLDEKLGLAQYVKEKISKQVDSGYSTTIIMTKGNYPEDTTLVFYSQPSQKVQLYVSSVTRPEQSDFRPTVKIQCQGAEVPFLKDGQPVTTGLKNTDGLQDITHLLDAAQVQKEEKVIRIVISHAREYLTSHPDGPLLIVNVLVLVSNDRPTNEKTIKRSD